MNGITVRCGAPRHIRQQQIERVAWFADGFGRLREWRNDEFARLARRFDPEADVPLRLWQQEWPPGPRASRDAFARVIGPEFVPPPL